MMQCLRGGLNGGSQKDLSLSLYREPANVTSFGKEAFAEVLKDLEMRSSQIIWVGPKSNDKYP